MTSVSPAAFMENPLAGAPVRLLYGEETQLLTDARDAARRRFSADNYRFADLENLDKSPLMEERGKGLFGGQAAELSEVTGYGAPGKEAREALVKLAARTRAPDALLITLYNLEYKHEKAAWFKSIADAAVCVKAAALPAKQAEAWLTRWAGEANIALADDAREFLAAQTEGNLAAAKQAIMKLSLADAGGDIAGVRAALSDGAKYDAFDLTGAILSGGGTRAVAVLRQIRAVEDIDVLIVWHASNIITSILAVQSGGRPTVWGRQAAEVKAIAARAPAAAVRALLRQAFYVDRVVKGVAAGDKETALTQLTANLAMLRRGVKINLPNYHL